MSAQRMYELVATPWEAAGDFMRNERLRGAVAACWLASFGSALHSPVTTFYYLEMGASVADIGTYGLVVSLGAVMTAPVQGWYADKSSSYPVLFVGVIACTVGCFVRGYSPTVGYILPGLAILSFLGGQNLTAITLAHIVKAAPETKRTTYVSALLAQEGAFQIVAKILFPLIDLWWRTAGVSNRLVRQRLHLTSCVAFCVVGVVMVYRSRHALRMPADDHRIDSPLVAPVAVTPSLERSNKAGLFLSNAALLCQGAAKTGLQLVWPLFLRERYGWESVQYAYALFLCSCATTLAVSFATQLEQLGHTAAVLLLSFAGATTGFLSLAAPAMLPDGGGTLAVHVTLYIACVAAVAGLDPVIRVGASYFTLPSSQGRAFGGLATSSELGSMLGSVAAAQLYQQQAGTKDSGEHSMLMVISALALISLSQTVMTPPKHGLGVGNGSSGGSGGISAPRTSAEAEGDELQHRDVPDDVASL